MKAAILNKLGELPIYGDSYEPMIPGEGESIMHVKAASIKQLDKAKAAGKHYTTYATLPAIVGTDGVGMLDNGKMVYAMLAAGMLAERVVVPDKACIELPLGIDMAVAAALPNALIGSDAALCLRAKIKPGDVILINGATGVSGKVAVQMAKYRGASKVIVTGRNKELLEALKLVGADATVSLLQRDEAVIAQLHEINTASRFDIVLDYLWGSPMEKVFKALQQCKPYPVKVVLVGEMAGSSLGIATGMLRSTKIELLGSGIGSIDMLDLQAYIRMNLPELLGLHKAGKLQIDITKFELSAVGAAWTYQEPGRRAVVVL